MDISMDIRIHGNPGKHTIAFVDIDVLLRVHSLFSSHTELPQTLISAFLS